MIALKITIEGTEKEIADLVSALQGQRNEGKMETAELYPNPCSIHAEAIRGMLEGNSAKSARNEE